jgi:hypothetical protein
LGLGLLPRPDVHTDASLKAARRLDRKMNAYIRASQQAASKS